jgi:predicted AAA+ superfamily ATPase
MKSYARLQGTQSNLSAIRKDIVANESQGISEDTIASYLKALKGIFVVEELPAWCPELRSRDSVRTSDTRFFVDPSIAAVALGTTPNGLMDDLRSYGYFFEALAVRDLRTYMDVVDGCVKRYHDKTGLECDAVMQSWDGSYALAEVKLGGESLIEEGAAALNKLRSLIEGRGLSLPRFLMVVTAVGEFAYRRKEDGVIVCPISCLKP